MKQTLFLSIFILFGCVCGTNEAEGKPQKIEIFGPKEVSAAFDIPLSKIETPPIPWTKEELEKARKNGMVLILRVCPEGFPNTMADMIPHYKKIGNQIASLPEDGLRGLVHPDYNTSACALRTGWALVDIFPQEWTTDRTYEEQIHEALKRGRTFKMLPETLYDAILLHKRYSKKEGLPNGYFISRTGSFSGIYNLFIGQNPGKLTIIFADSLLHYSTIKMLTQMIK